MDDGQFRAIRQRAECDDWRVVDGVIRIHEALEPAIEDDRMHARLCGYPAKFTAVERDGVQVALQWALSSADEVDDARRLIDPDDRLHHPVALGERSNQ